MLIVLGVNVFPSAVKDIVSSFHPHTTGEIQIVLDAPPPKVAPPLKVRAEHSRNANLKTLKNEIEKKIKSMLTVAATVTLVPPGTLPHFEMKGQLVKKIYGDNK